MLPPIDAHAHVNVRAHPADLADLGAVVLAVTGSAAEWRAAAARADELTLWGLGCHPADREAVGAFRVGEFRAALRTATFVGEVGLDRKSPVPLTRQIEVFRDVCECLEEAPRPVSIHSAGATRQVLDVLEGHQLQAAILHWWRGTAGETERAVELGCFFSVNGHEARTPKVIEIAPRDRILTETDFPYSTRYDRQADRPAAVETIEQVLQDRYELEGRDDLRKLLWTNLRHVFVGADAAVPSATHWNGARGLLGDALSGGDASVADALAPAAVAIDWSGDGDGDGEDAVGKGPLPLKGSGIAPIRIRSRGGQGGGVGAAGGGEWVAVPGQDDRQVDVERERREADPEYWRDVLRIVRGNIRDGHATDWAIDTIRQALDGQDVRPDGWERDQPSR